MTTPKTLPSRDGAHVMATRRIYIPDELDERMKAKGKSVNWSRIAQTAFEGELDKRAELPRRSEGMTGVIERLRKSKARGEEASYQAGQQAGDKWAKHQAEWLELASLAENMSDPRIWDGIP